VKNEDGTACKDFERAYSAENVFRIVLAVQFTKKVQLIDI
jgi:hypothetical protein